jgi:hypothetical protein
VRETIYTGLAHRNPILLTWEERIVENERIVFEQIRHAVDWSQPFQRPPLAIRVDATLMPVAGREPLFRCENALSQIPLEACYVWEDEPVPAGTVATLDARQPFVAPTFVSRGGTLPDELKSRLPLVLPAGWAANYSWSEDRRTLLAFLRRMDLREGEWKTAEGGNCTCADTTLRIEKDGLVDTWETRCLKPGKIHLLGFYIPDKDTEIAARHGGRMLFVEGSAAERSAVADWQTEARRADLAAFRKEDPARRQPSAPEAAAGLVLQNFPAEELTFQLLDLATRQPVLQGDFRQTRSLTDPLAGDHFFLLVRPPERHASLPTGERRGE